MAASLATCHRSADACLVSSVAIRSAFIESEQNAARLQLQNDALLAERVDLYMKMQVHISHHLPPSPTISHDLHLPSPSALHRDVLLLLLQALESQLSIATSDKDNLDKELRALVNIPTKLEEIQSQVGLCTAISALPGRLLRVHLFLAAPDGGAAPCARPRQPKVATLFVRAPLVTLTWSVPRVSHGLYISRLVEQGVRQIAVGEKHILALSDSGDVYAWGSGSSGQLGLGKKRGFPSPQLVWGLMRKGVRQISAGNAHSLALTYNGMVYSWGSGKAGQLGHGDRATQPLPKLIQYLDENVRWAAPHPHLHRTPCSLSLKAVIALPCLALPCLAWPGLGLALSCLSLAYNLLMRL